MYPISKNTAIKKKGIIWFLGLKQWHKNLPVCGESCNRVIPQLSLNQSDKTEHPKGKLFDASCLELAFQRKPVIKGWGPLFKSASHSYKTISLICNHNLILGMLI